MHRVMPPRRLRQSQLREALNASYGIDDPDDTPAAAEPRSRRRRRLRIRTASLPTLGWL
jgi:hypothetical protein